MCYENIAFRSFVNCNSFFFFFFFFFPFGVTHTYVGHILFLVFSFCIAFAAIEDCLLALLYPRGISGVGALNSGFLSFLLYLCFFFHASETSDLILLIFLFLHSRFLL